MSSPTTEPSTSVELSLPYRRARTIDVLAKERGVDRARFIVDFLEKELNGSVPTFEQMMAPIAEDFRRSVMSEEDLDALVEQERQAMDNACRSGFPA
jgi:hypothetical protein